MCLEGAVCHLNYSSLVRKTALSMWYWPFLVALKWHVPRQSYSQTKKTTAYISWPHPENDSSPTRLQKII